MIIAGEKSANSVIIMPHLEETYTDLKAMEKTYYWATIAVNEIRALSSGHYKSSVFIHADEILSESTQQFKMVVPGCEISFIKCSSGEYLINKMEVNKLYPKMQEDGDKPGFYSVRYDKSAGWIPTYQPDGQVKNEQYRTVAITDQYEKIEDAAQTAGLQLGNAPISPGTSILKDSGFDMHFTPGKDKIGGAMNISQARNAATSESLHESALQLARAVEKAKDVHGVRWISVEGGSGVLTQAMAILKTKDISFKDTKHHVFFSHLTTDLVIAQQLATDIGLKFGNRVKSASHFRLNESAGALGVIGGHIAAWRRFKQDPKRTRLMLTGDMIRETLGSYGAVKAAGVYAAVAGIVLGIATATPATQLIINAAGLGGAASLSVLFAKATFPEPYAKFISKFG